MVIMASMGVRSETTAIGHPVVTLGGVVAYQVDKIVRLEGNWQNPQHEGNALLFEGLLLFPKKPVAIRGMERRLGAAVIFFFPQSGNPYVWRGCHVHDGYVPAYGGKPAVELISEIERTPLLRPEAILPAADANLPPIDIRIVIAKRQQLAARR